MPEAGFLDDDRLPNKTQVHAVFPFDFEGESTVPRVYSIDNFDSTIEVIQEPFDVQEVVVAGSYELNFTVSFYNEPSIGDRLSFEPVQNELPVIMQDDEGNKWNIFGEAVSGHRRGSKLVSKASNSGYWFAFADFYPGFRN